ncbi:GNAT family N-acetyltransferase [Photobacterium sanguinicancri]|uniref:GNAT family N-acetyltransferase n=1 Tax=Photobacterium sanguinicancri TaxID=875932 RepID=UPI003D0FCB90
MEITKADIGHAELFKNYAEDCVQEGLELYDEAKLDSHAYLKKRIAYSEGKELPAGWAPISTYFYIESGIICGSIRFRHGTNEYIENVIGHIGYDTLARARGRGVATKMLRWIVNNIIEHRVIITCDEDNIASSRVIEKCGGESLSTFYCEDEQRNVLRYQLERTSKIAQSDS